MIGGGRGRAGFAIAPVALAVVLAAASCGQSSQPEDTVRIQSAVNSNVVVTVVDHASVPQANVEVYAVKNNGSIQTSAFTNASGQATLSVPASSYRFKVEEAGSNFFSGSAGHCVTPGCTTASITIRRVDVTVVNTSGTPQQGLEVIWEKSNGSTGGYVTTGANGHALVAVPNASYRFLVEMNGWEFTSSATFNCTVPGCTTATITVTIPVTVTVTNTSGTPIQNQTVGWEATGGANGG